MLNEKIELLGKEIVDIAFQIHINLGPGLLESVYEKCFFYELNKRNISYKCQQSIQIIYDEHQIDDGLRLDLIVEDLIIIELKAQENYNKVWEAQLLSYLRLADKELGYIINFNVPKRKEGIKRMIL
jgi:GxxExxY protein